MSAYHRMNVLDPSPDRDYIPISDHALIGNLRTAALISIDGSVESYCVPNFDSPSIFARILDKDKGGHFSITPTVPFTTKQNYLPSSNVLQTKFMNEHGVASVTDFLPRVPSTESGSKKPLLPWLIRRVEVIRGQMPMSMQCAPAFNYAQSKHSMEIIDDDSSPYAYVSSRFRHMKAMFKSEDGMSLDLRYVVESTMEAVNPPVIRLEPLDLTTKGHKGLAASANLNLDAGHEYPAFFYTQTPMQSRAPSPSLLASLTQDAKMQIEGETKENTENTISTQPSADMSTPPALVPVSSLGHGRTRPVEDPYLTAELIAALLKATNKYWNDWVRKSKYDGMWKEAVPPQDYRFSWIRDSSFILYALIRLGYTHEANAYMDFIFERLRDKNPDGSIQIMYTIHGSKDMEELELNHLDGHKGSKPVRVGNGAADHVQLDIYGELMDCIYLGQKFGKPLSYDDWVLVRDLVDYVVSIWQQPDLSIWEVRNMKRNFTYSKIMLWVAIDRGIRLAEKRSFPCPQREKWYAARDSIYEEIMQKSWNTDLKAFGQSYEKNDVMDSAVLIMPLVFFLHGSDPRFLSTLKQILKTPERGGLTSNNLVYRYDVKKADDGVGGEEGTFCLCTLWCVEALARAGEYDKAMLRKAVNMFEDFLLYLNHVGLCTEEISEAGEGLGNAVQGFTHVTLISAAYNLSRNLSRSGDS
ncbi:glycoside hydrolase family 15 protein [Schizophyllum amplum]|uniref:Glycoside hydrolase family 15 protein n=1 Tax=Schizophyllum amplum TaxID=97359 RepID=A0A550C7C5_9AGAR|nr:glycoside hydrolase family 15 protein [Auriculariopsis ampla]